MKYYRGPFGLCKLETSNIPTGFAQWQEITKAEYDQLMEWEKESRAEKFHGTDDQ